MAVTDATAVRSADKRPAARRRARVCARDRLLALRTTAPRLSDEDAEFMLRVVREAREASIGDQVPA